MHDIIVTSLACHTEGCPERGVWHNRTAGMRDECATCGLPRTIMDMDIRVETNARAGEGEGHP